LLFNCLLLARRNDDAAKIAEYNFKKFPDYLFGRLNYASSFLLNKDYKSIPRLFNFHVDLNRVAPHRSKFHISEVLYFHKTLYYYYMGIKEFNNAKHHSKIVASLDIEGHTRKELSRYNSRIIKKRILVIFFSILSVPIVLFLWIFDLITNTIKNIRKNQEL
jgi:hypothetical protein